MPSPLREGVCVICNATFVARRSSTCSRRCSAILRERNKAENGTQPQPIADPPEFVNRVRALYESGMTLAEVAAELGTSRKVPQRVMKRNGIARRPAVARDARGDRNCHWKGADAGYQAFHLRVAAKRGKPSLCSLCGASDPTIRYEWANLTGDYADVNDYERMCVPCHRRFDAARRAATGEPTSPKGRRTDA